MREKKTQRYFSVVQFAYWSGILGGTYINTYLKKSSLSGTQIGIVTAIGGVIATVLLVALGNLSDRLGSAKKPLMAMAGIEAVILMMVPISYHLTGGKVVPLMLVGVVATAGYNQLQSLNDSFCVQGIADSGITYSTIRKWGAVGYIVISLFSTVLIAKGFPMGGIFFMSAGLAIPLIVLVGSSRRFVPWVDEKTHRRAKEDFYTVARKLFKNPRFLIFLIAVTGFNVQHAVTFKYLPYVIEHAGIDSKYLALFTGARSIIEVLTMLLCAKIVSRKNVKLWLVVMFCGVFFTLEHIAYPLAHGWLAMFASMIPSGIASGIQYGVIPNYIFRITEEGTKATGQSLNGASHAIVGVIGALVGGVVIDRFGINRLVMGNGVLILIATLFFLFGNLLMDKKEEKGVGL